MGALSHRLYPKILVPRRFTHTLTILALFLTGERLGATCSSCPGTPLSVGMCSTTDIVHTGSGCGGFNNCQNPTVGSPSISILPQGGGVFTARMTVTVTAPWNQSVAVSNPNGTLDMTWFDTSTAPTPWTSGGNPSLCEYLASDRVQTYVEKTGLTCSGAPYSYGTYSLRASTCSGPCPPPFFPSCGSFCGKWVDTGGLEFTVTAAMMGCPAPKKWSCPDDASSCPTCGGCIGGTSGGAGGGPGVGPGLSGPGATLRYTAGGAGGTGFPGTSAWTPTFGRYWSHDYAERIVIDPVTGNDTHVWMITRNATFREFTGLSGGVYGTVSPTDEYRKLHRTGSGWELHGLDGSVEVFDSGGLWTSTTDRNGNAKVATYTSGKLTSVAFPDGRSETFTYSSGRLATIVEHGVGSGSRTWTYTWSGDDLTRIDRPLGPAWEFHYDDTNFPGYMTRMDLVDASSNRRVVAAWEYDLSGNVVKTWKGDTSFTGTDAVEKWSFSFDNPLLPATTTVTDPLGNTSTYTFGRDSNSDKPRLASISGDCPACGSANTQLSYGDTANPLRATSIIDGRGTTTLFAYDANGQTTSKTEANGNALARTTTWAYSTSFPAFVTAIDVPSTSGSGYRHTGLSYNSTGDLIGSTVEGIEAGSAFSYTTSTTYNTAGQPLTINPPGYSTTDVTSFTYDSTRGDLVPLTRTDPIVGTTAFTHDPFNRSTQVTDPNSVSSVTAYDDLNRVTSQTEKGATTPGDEVTSYDFNNFGDPLRTTLPLGNVVEYGYDAAGRLISTEKKPNASTHGERAFYTLDGAGNRTQVDLQHWSGSAWVTDSTTQHVFSTRCHLDKTVNADSTVTEYAYDCNNNLTKIWDANHPSSSQTNPATNVYGYDVLNRMTSTTQPWGGTGGGNAVTSYTYDVQDHLASLTDATGNPTSYTTSDRDLLTQEVSNVSGTTAYSYNEHGQRVQETDARPITVSRTYDALDRLTFIDYVDGNLDTTFTYDDPLVSFSKGRLTAIDRGITSLSYTYDRFGRMTQDGSLTLSYDKNGNPLTLGYPAGVTATYTYDFADRQSTLEMQDGASTPQTLVSASSYKPFGPLASLTFGNSLTETHAYTTRYLPSSIAVGSLLSWSYGTDSLGNPTSITDTLNSANNRTYAYQSNQYYLTTGNGPWGTRSWTYDKIGNRLTETRGGTTDTYTYLTNSASGHKAQIDQINGTTTYDYDDVGDVVDNGSLDSAYGDDRRLSLTSAGSFWPNTTYEYDGRGFLSGAIYTPEQEAADTDQTYPTYNSAGLFLHRNAHRRAKLLPSTPASDSALYIVYFAGRPAATLDKVTQSSTTTSTLRYLSTDHLGTPILVTSTAGTQVWQGGFEPFGKDWSSSPTLLRFPGQWSDATWNGNKGYGLYYNVNRWYEDGRGRYTQPDPLGLAGGLQLYGYADQDPLFTTDLLGLLTAKACGSRFISFAGGVNHIPLIGPYLDKQVGNNLLGFCATCPASQSPANPHVSPTPPAENGTPDLTLLAAGAVTPGVDGVRKECGGCNKPGQRFYVVNVKTRLAFTTGDLEKTKGKYSLDYGCKECKKPN